MTNIQLVDKIFTPYLSSEEIQDQIHVLAHKISSHYQGKEITLLIVLKGAFRFGADLCQALRLKLRLEFLQLSSYQGTQSSGRMEMVLGLKHSLKNQHVLIVEDIVDTGQTLEYLYPLLKKEFPASLECASLLFKPNKYTFQNAPKFVAFEIENQFVVGYGLDYEEEGRELNGIYQLKS